MSVGGVAEAVTVRADASAVNARSGELSYLVAEQAIEDLPLNGLSVRPIQWDIETPQVRVWNLNLQREMLGTALTIGYAGSRGRHLLRSNDVNTAMPITGTDGLPFFPAGAPRINTAWTTIELKSSDGDSWYRALILEARRRWSNGVMFQSAYTWSKSEDTTQASTFFSDATNGTTSAFPEFIPATGSARDPGAVLEKRCRCRLPMLREDGLLAVLRERDHVERLFPAALFHAGRTHRHAGRGDAGNRGLFFQQPLDVGRGHVPLNHIAADCRGVA